jgi:hypothetical protein
MRARATVFVALALGTVATVQAGSGRARAVAQQGDDNNFVWRVARSGSIF